MALRAVWKGFVKFGSVACGIKLINAISESDRIRFRILNRKDRLPVKAAFVDEETGEVVDTEDQVKGYELDKGGYLLLEPDEIKKLKLTSNHTLEAEEFVDLASIDQRYLDKPYYVVPGDAGGPRAVCRDPRSTEEEAVCGEVVHRSLPARPGGGDPAGWQGHDHDHASQQQRGHFGEDSLRRHQRTRSPIRT